MAQPSPSPFKNRMTNGMDSIFSGEMLDGCTEHNTFSCWVNISLNQTFYKNKITSQHFLLKVDANVLVTNSDFMHYKYTRISLPGVKYLKLDIA